MPDSSNRRLWLISGVLVPLVGAIIAAVPLWIEVISPRINDDDKPTPTAVLTIAPTSTPSGDLLQAGLLQPVDLPAGWVETGRKIVEEPCGLHITRQGMAGTTIAYEAVDQLGYSYVYQEVAQHFAGNAEALFAYITGVIDSCSSSTATSPDGQIVTSSVLPLVFPQLGDQSYAFREIVPGITQNFTTDTVVIRRNQLVTILAITDLGTATDGTFELFVESTAYAANFRLADVAQAVMRR